MTALGILGARQPDDLLELSRQGARQRELVLDPDVRPLLLTLRNEAVFAADEVDGYVAPLQHLGDLLAVIARPAGQIGLRQHQIAAVLEIAAQFRDGVFQPVGRLGEIDDLPLRHDFRPRGGRSARRLPVGFRTRRKALHGVRDVDGEVDKLGVVSLAVTVADVGPKHAFAVDEEPVGRRALQLAGKRVAVDRNALDLENALLLAVDVHAEALLGGGCEFLNLADAPFALEEARADNRHEQGRVGEPARNLPLEIVIVADFTVAPNPRIVAEIDADLAQEVLVELRDPALLLAPNPVVVSVRIADENVGLEQPTIFAEGDALRHSASGAH